MFSQLIDAASSNINSAFLRPLNIPSNSSIDSPTNLEIPQYPKKSGKWTIEEDDLLRKYVDLFGEKQWRKISQHIPGRTSIQCLHRWSKILRPGLVKGPWTPEEDQKLVAWVESEGPNKWAQAANYIVGRSGKQCRERWFNNLNPDVKKGEWTKEEDELIFELYKKHGSSWSRIAKLVPGRTENSIKNRFYSTLRRLTADRKKSTNIKSCVSDSSATPDNMEEEISKTTADCVGQTHTLYKLLQESTLTEEDKEQTEDDGKSDKSIKHSIKLLANRKSSNVSSKSFSSQESGNASFKKLFEENQCKIESPEESDQLRLQNLVMKMNNNKLPTAEAIPRLGTFNLHPIQQQQQRLAQYYQPAQQGVQIPRLFPTTRPQAVHRPVVPMQEEVNIPKLTPLRIPSGFSQRNLQPINFNVMSQSPHRIPLLNNLNRVQSNPLIPALNEKAGSMSPFDYLRNCLKGTKQTSQCSETTVASLSEAQDGFGLGSLQLRRDESSNSLFEMNKNMNKVYNMQQTCLSNLIQAARNMPTAQPEQNGSNVSGLLNQINNLQEIFTNVKGQLIRLESSLKTPKPTDIRMIPQLKAKRSLDDVMQYNANVRMESEDALMKKIKVE